MKISIYYAQNAETIWHDELDVPDQTTIADALDASGFYDIFQEYSAQNIQTGVYGKKRAPDHMLSDGDRIEIYRPLSFNPMESRRRRAAHKKAGILKKRHLKSDRSKHSEYIEHTPDGSTRGIT